MKVFSGMLLVPLSARALAAFTAMPAWSDDYTCDDDGPCIIEADQVGKYSVRLRWSGQGTRYDFYKIILRTHGGGDEKEIRVRGKRGGKSRFNLHEPGDYEITVAGCNGPSSNADCRLSSEKVRMNLF